jgi:molybdate transport system regulatory protein
LTSFKRLQPGYNLWLEIDGKVVLSLWRADLLRAVASCGSISAAAEELQIPYRTAWQKIHEMETRLGVRLVETQTGGQHGGGAKLTPTAEEYLEKFESFAQDMERFVVDSFDANFGKH